MLVRSCYPLHARNKMLQHLWSCESPKMRHRKKLQEHVALQDAQVVLQALPLHQGCLQSPSFTRATRVRPSQQPISSTKSTPRPLLTLCQSAQHLGMVSQENTFQRVAIPTPPSPGVVGNPLPTGATLSTGVTSPAVGV